METPAILKLAAFISRHAPTGEQVVLAEKAGYVLHHLGDRDAFTGELVTAMEDTDFAVPEVVRTADNAAFDAVVVVHPAAALRYQAVGMPVLVFENGSRPAVGGKPEFFAKALWVFGGNTGNDWIDKAGPLKVE